MMMQKLRLSKLLKISILLCGMLTLFTARAAESDPVVVLQSAADSMIAGLKANQATLKSKPNIVYSLAHKYVVPHADLEEMSKRVLPAQIWNSATSAQRQRFKQLFTTTLIRTYASALTAYQDQQVKFFPIRGSYVDQSVVQVNSQIISSESDPINVTYTMIRGGGSWRLIDMSVEGVGMLDSFRSQFADILEQGNMEQLLQRLSQHNMRNS